MLEKSLRWEVQRASSSGLSADSPVFYRSITTEILMSNLSANILYSWQTQDTPEHLVTEIGATELKAFSMEQAAVNDRWGV